MAPLELVVLAGLAVFRLTRLVTVDDFPPVRVVRTWVLNRKVEWLSDLVTCHWCASGWISAGLLGAYYVAPAAVAPVIFAAAAWGVGALVADWQARRDQ